VDRYVEDADLLLPFQLEQLELYDGPLPPGHRVQCRLQIAQSDDMSVAADAVLVREDGRLWARLRQWRARRFDVPRWTYAFTLCPREARLGQPWDVARDLLGEAAPVYGRCARVDEYPDSFFTRHGGIWQRTMVCTNLSRREREVFRGLRTPEARRLDWLLGRQAAKGAVKAYLEERHGLSGLCPADIEILPDEHGRPVPGGAWARQAGTVPLLSISHVEGVAVAVAADGGTALGLGVDIEPVGRMQEAMREVAFGPEERELLAGSVAADDEDWWLRLWCAKEAVGKALGRGLTGGPQALTVVEADLQTGSVSVRVSSEERHTAAPGTPGTLRAVTARQDDLIIAVCLAQPERMADDGCEP
jgi:phosphopantetheinyl transferase